MLAVALGQLADQVGGLIDTGHDVVLSSSPDGSVPLIEEVILSGGWRRRAIAFISGATGALALPPLSLFVLIAVPLTAAVWLIDGAQDRQRERSPIASPIAAFGAGWWMGFGYFLAGLWWVGSAPLVEADKFAWALPLAVLALPAALAVFPAAGFALARLLWSPGPLRICALAFGLGVTEWARGLLFTGFPWNDLGMALGANLALAQTASLVGLHGLTFLTILIFAAPATLWRVSENQFNLAPTIVAVLALILMATSGELRLMSPPSVTIPGVKLRLIQPNIAQDDASFGPENKQAILRRYFDLSERATSPSARRPGCDPLDLAQVRLSLHFISQLAGSFQNRGLFRRGHDANHWRSAAREWTPAKLLQFY